MAVLADAELDEAERAVLERFVAAVVAEYGQALDGVWLYGSRARGERAHDESDIDLLVVTRDERDDDPLYAIQHRVLVEACDPPVLLEPRTRRARERDENARTHKGTWDLFRRRFVSAGDFDETLWRAAQRAGAARGQRLRGRRVRPRRGARAP